VPTARTACCLLLVVSLGTSPVWAQHPLQDSAASQAAAAAATQSSRRPLFLTGVVLGIAGGAAIVIGTTVAKTTNSTSGNSPTNTFDSCEALKANPVYRGNECDVLKGPNTALVVGGAVLAAAGVTLAIVGAPHSSIAFGPGSVAIRHRLTF
jgi:hypothetical protein